MFPEIIKINENRINSFKELNCIFNNNLVGFTYFSFYYKLYLRKGICLVYRRIKKEQYALYDAESFNEY